MRVCVYLYTYKSYNIIYIYIHRYEICRFECRHVLICGTYVCLFCSALILSKILSQTANEWNASACRAAVWRCITAVETAEIHRACISEKSRNHKLPFCCSSSFSSWESLENAGSDFEKQKNTICETADKYLSMRGIEGSNKSGRTLRVKVVMVVVMNWSWISMKKMGRFGAHGRPAERQLHSAALRLPQYQRWPWHSTCPGDIPPWGTWVTLW